MVSVLRYDSAPLKATKSEFGFLRGDAYVTRTGVFSYRRSDGSTVRELRHPDDVFAAKSLESLRMVPMTLDHSAGDEALTPATARQHMIGVVGESVRAEGIYVRAPFVVTDAAAIAAIEAGARQLSCGYRCDTEKAPAGSVYDGEPYDVRQKNIVYNHVAALARGRAGEHVSIRLDGEDAECIDVVTDVHTEEQPQMTVKIKIDGVDVDVASEQAAQVITKSLAALTAEAVASRAALETAKGRNDALDEEVKRLRADAAPAAIDARVAARVALVAQATKILGAEFKADGLDDAAVKRAVVLKTSPDAKLDGKSAEYVEARFDSAVESFERDQKRADESDASRAGARVAAVNANGGASSQTARQKMIDRNRAIGLA